MNNPFAKPQTQEQWLLSSVCWTVTCLGIWWLIVNQLIHWCLPGGGIYIFEIGLFGLSHVLIWRRALAKGDYFLSSPISQTSFLEAIGCLWFALLIVFQIASLIVGAVFMILLIAFSGISGSSEWPG